MSTPVPPAVVAAGRALAVGLAAWAVALGGPAAAAAPPAEVTDVAVQDRTATFTVEVGAAADGTPLDPGTVRVRSGEVDWPATATGEDGAGEPLSRRAVIAVDTSGSMGADGIADARQAAQAFLTAVPDDVAVGLVTFSATAEVVVAPTTDRRPLRAALAEMKAGGDTALYDGLATSLQALGDDGDRAVLLLSDGEDTASTATFEQSRDDLAASGVHSRLVGFGTGAELDVLAELAGESGSAVEAADGGELESLFAASAEDLVQTVTVTAQVPAGVGGGTGVTIEVGSGDAVAVAQTGVTLPEVPAAPVSLPRGAVAGAASPAWFLPVAVVLAFAGLFGLAAVLLSPGTWRSSTSTRRALDVQRYALVGAGGASATDPTASPTAVGQAALAWADRRVQARGTAHATQLLLDRAALPLKPHEWLLLRLGLVVVGLVAGVLLLPWWLLTAPLVALLLWLAAGVYLKIRAGRRAGKFAEALPDVLHLVAGSLSTGFSFPQALDNAATEGQEPIAGELSRALAESRLGVSLEDCLERVAERMASKDLEWTVMAVRISREVGGNLAEVLTTTAETMRERGRVQRQVKTLSAEGRLSAYILIALPIGIAAWMAAFRPAYVAPLVTEPLGLVMTAFAVLTMAFGAWWMSRLIKLEV